MVIFQCDLIIKNYGALWNNLFNFFHLKCKMRAKYSVKMVREDEKNNLPV